jgi:hypothetical protein
MLARLTGRAPAAASPPKGPLQNIAKKVANTTAQDIQGMEQNAVTCVGVFNRANHDQLVSVASNLLFKTILKNMVNNLIGTTTQNKTAAEFIGTTKENVKALIKEYPKYGILLNSIIDATNVNIDATLSQSDQLMVVKDAVINATNQYLNIDCNELLNPIGNGPMARPNDAVLTPEEIADILTKVSDAEIRRNLEYKLRNAVIGLGNSHLLRRNFYNELLAENDQNLRNTLAQTYVDAAVGGYRKKRSPKSRKHRAMKKRYYSRKN